MSAAFSLESSTAFNFKPAQSGQTSDPVRVEVFNRPSQGGNGGKGLRLVAAKVPGPLCSVTIVVPTAVLNDSGLPHTLEHLIFCGSAKHPHRGFLDTLATRSLSTGTNAWTAEDHTAYTITCAGSEGMMNLLPVFLDHIVNPTLTDDQFLTEVYHIDGQGKEQGVVFCEMAGRENTESDLLDLAIRRALYSNTSTYSMECGGKTDLIRHLTNAGIKSYHRSCYSLDDLVVIICGTFDTDLVIRSLEKVEQKSIDSVASSSAAPITSPPLEKSVDQRIEFPSADEDIGTIAYSWRGPASSDITTILALEVLFRYLQENSASPLNQAFVETRNPWASEIDFDIKCFLDTGIVLYFSGVPYGDGDGEAAVTDDEDEDWEDTEKADDGESDDGHSEDEDDEDGDEHDDDDDGGAELPDDLFAAGVFKTKLFAILKGIADSGIPSQDITRTVNRYRRKILETFEDDPHELLSSYLIPDILRHRWIPPNTKDGAMHLGTRATMVSVLESLKEKPARFWQELIKTWLINAPCVETIACPSRKLADEKAKSDEAALAARRAELGEKGLAEKGAIAKRAFEANSPELPTDILESLPPVPAIHALPKLHAKTEIVDVHSSKSHTARPFGQALSVETDSAFVFVRLAFNTANIPTELRHYLVLFQELLFQSPVQIGDELVEYRDIVRRCAEIFVSFEAAVGFGNDVWSAAWLSEVLILTASVEAENWTESMKFFVQVLLFSKFTIDRILVSVKKLLSDAIELKRDGASMMSATITRLTASPASPGNDTHISIFRQEGFLQGLAEELKGANAEKKFAEVEKSLDEIRRILVATIANAPGFIEIAFPKGLSSTVQPLDSLLGIWDSQSAIFESVKANAVNGVVDGASVSCAFPFPREPFSLSNGDKSIPSALLVPIQGLDASYLTVLTECNVIGTKDFFAVSLLVELLSRTEGPLYTRVRGKGYAYGANMHIAQWNGQLSFEVLESSDPSSSLYEFFSILDELKTEEGWNNHISQFHIETARAAVAYKLVSARATVGGVIVSSLRSALQGLTTAEQQAAHEKDLYTMTTDDLKRVFTKFFLPFFDERKRLTVLVTNQQSLVDVFAKAKWKVDFAVRTLAELRN